MPSKGAWGAMRGLGATRIRGKKKKPQMIRVSNVKVVMVQKSDRPLTPTELAFKDLCESITEEQSIVLRGMPYSDFLISPYWKTVGNYVRVVRKNVCQNCLRKAKPKEILQCHHKTYARHGSEHIHWKEDLVILCRKCHKKAHGLT